MVTEAKSPIRLNGGATFDHANLISVSLQFVCGCNFNKTLTQMFASRIFSILINSMPDERTNSTITWFNSPYRGNQLAGNLVDMIQVGQWYGVHSTVRFI